MRQEYLVPVPRRPRPLLSGLAAELILRAFHEAARTRSRKDAAAAILWIRARSRWTDIPLERRLACWGAPAPPREIRQEYALSFSWACEIAGLDEDQIRKNGPPWGDSRTNRPVGGLLNWRFWRETRGQRRQPTRPQFAADPPAELVCN